jgi:mevalonate kinase
MQEINSLVESVITELDKTGQTKPEFVSRNQELLSELSVSHPKIDLIVSIAKQHNLNAKVI